MKIRIAFATSFLGFCVLSAYLGFADLQFQGQSDKLLHFVTFFIISIAFYWALDATRKRCINATALVCTGCLGVGSEFVQGLLPYRTFDSYDILCNVIGSGLAIALSAWYHKRLLARKRSARYQALHQDDNNTTNSTLARQAMGTAPEPDLEAQINVIPPSTRSNSGSPVNNNGSSVQLQEVAPEPVK